MTKSEIKKLSRRKLEDLIYKIYNNRYEQRPSYMLLRGYFGDSCVDFYGVKTERDLGIVSALKLERGLFRNYLDYIRGNSTYDHYKDISREYANKLK